MGRLTGHPNIVNVLQVGTTANGHPYIVMPYYEQRSLDVRIRDHGPLSLEQTLQLGVKLAGAVKAGVAVNVPVAVSNPSGRCAMPKSESADSP